LLVFGRWAAGTWHKARLDSERAAVKVAAVPVVAERSMNEKSATQSQEAEAIAAAAAAVQPTPDATPAMKVAEAPVSPAVDVSATVKTPTRAMENDDENPLYAPTSSAVAFEQVIELKVTGDTEARVTLDGKKVDQTWYESNSYRFTFNERAEVYLLDASKVDLIYNGKSLGVLGNAGRRRKILFQAKASAEDFPSY
jgi:cytoskeletal protein RodZ